MEILRQIPLPFAAFWFLFTSLLAPVTPNMENSREGCAIHERLAAERAQLNSFSFDAFFLLSAMHVQVTIGNRSVRIYVTENSTAILTDDFKYEEKPLPRHISGWTSFILSVTDTVHLVTQDGIDIMGPLEKGNLRIDSYQDFKADISNVPLMSGCIEGGPTVSVKPVGELNLLIMLPRHQYNFTVLGSQIFNLSLFINDHKITSLCGKGNADFILEFHATKNQEHRIIIPGTQPLPFHMPPKSSDGSEWITVSFHTMGQALHVTYNLPWKKRLTSLQKPGFVKICSFDDNGDEIFTTDREMVPTATDELPVTTSTSLAQVSTISIDPEPSSSTLEYFGSIELAVLVLILIILLIIVILVIVLGFMKSRRKAGVVKGEFPSQQSTLASASFQLARNRSHFPKCDPDPLKIPALFGREPSNIAMAAKFAKSYRQESDEEMHEENIYEEIITSGEITLTSSSASYCNYPVSDLIQEDNDGYVDMTKYERDRE